jgi:hypothetical protein
MTHAVNAAAGNQSIYWDGDAITLKDHISSLLRSRAATALLCYVSLALSYGD